VAIKRREFIQGVAVTAVGGLISTDLKADGLPFTQTVSPNTADYPPALTGLRGSHEGAYEVAHSLAFGTPNTSTTSAASEETYDLVIVGAGISGLAAAWFWHQAHPNDTILLLDNHDDFGGHAKRNEFTVEGKCLIGYGGSQSIEAPSHYSAVSRQLLADIGIVPDRFYDYYNQNFAREHGLRSRWFFDRAHYGQNALVDNPLGAEWLGIPPLENVDTLTAAMPLSPEDKRALARLLGSDTDWLAHLTLEQKIDYLRTVSYEDYLRKDVGMPDGIVLMLRNRAHGLWAVGYDALSALAAARAGEPGTTSLGLDDWLWGDEEDEPYIFHFPDGNATIARRLVQKLIPACLGGATPEDVVTARLNYALLDKDTNPIKIRLQSTVIKVSNTEDGASTTFVRQGQTHQVRSAKVILACYNHMIPHLCPELPSSQVEALQWPEKAPLVYTNVALRNWHAFKRAGLYHFQAVRDFWSYGMLDFPVSVPGYTFADHPGDPIILHLVHTPTAPGKPPREQYREGRQQLLSMDFADYEGHIRRQLGDMLGAYGFDFDRDVAAITVNRWPHGYAYEYIDLWDPPHWGPDEGPHILARQPFGNIAIANSDSSAYAYVNGAIDAAWRAVNSWPA
jgi:spermidine dehydrogenase